MIINQASLQGIYRSFKTLFQSAFEAAKPKYTEIATVVPSSTREEEYKWLGKIPRMREWIGDRVLQSLAAYGYTIKNKDFEATVAVDRNDIEDDVIGIYKPLVESIGQSAAEHPDELVFKLLKNGFVTTCYDGQPFFAAEHVDGEQAAQSNVTNKKLSSAEYATGRATIMSFVDDQGNPLNIVPDLLVVSPTNEGTGREILLAERDATGATNPWKDTAKLMVATELADKPNYWFLLCTSRPIKPLIFQQRKKPEFVAMDQANDANVFMRKEYIYGVDCRDNAGYSLWQLAYGSTGEQS